MLKLQPGGCDGFPRNALGLPGEVRARQGQTKDIAGVQEDEGERGEGRRAARRLAPFADPGGRRPQPDRRDRQAPRRAGPPLDEPLEGRRRREAESGDEAQGQEARLHELKQLLASYTFPPDLEPRGFLFGSVYDFLTALEIARAAARTPEARLALYEAFRLWAAQLVGWFAGPHFIPGGYDVLIGRILARLDLDHGAV